MRASCRESDADTPNQVYGLFPHRSLIRPRRAQFAPAGRTAPALLAASVLLSGMPLAAQTPPPDPLEVPLDWALIPAELGPGDTFRLLFVTSTEIGLTSDSIDHYNAFVQGRAAAGLEAIRAYSAHFRVLASTARVAARDNTGTNPGTDGAGEPIYWLGGGEKVADDYEDLYDEYWDSESWTTEAGGSGSEEDLGVLTGSRWDGRSKPKWPFRNIASEGDRVGGGMLNGSGLPMYSVDRIAGADGELSTRVYALSSVFQVAPDTLGPGGLYVADAMAVEGYTASFAVTMDGALPNAATVDYETSDGTATAGSDYTAASGTLTFAAGETSKTVSVAIPDDDDDEDIEEFWLTLSNPSANARLSDAVGTGQIDGGELTAEFIQPPTSHDGTAFRVFLRFSEEPDSSLSYRTLKGDGTREGALGVDNGRLDRVYRYGSGHRNILWRMVIVPDSVDVDIPITLRATTDCDAVNAICTDNGRRLSVPVTATVRGPPPRVSVADADAEEGANAAVDFAVTLSRAPVDTVTVDYTTSDGTATAGADYTAKSGTLTFDAGETGKTVSVPVLEDEAEEEDESFTLTLSNPANATLDDAAGTGTITDDDAAVAPLTAEFEDMPESHDGNPFGFGLTFSEEFGLSHLTLRDKAFDVTGGSVTGAQRKQTGSNRRWTITVEPDSAGGAVTITLPETTDCEADGAICTEDDRPLSHSLTAAVEGDDETVAPLTAEFEDMPESHDGDPFSFGLTFSEEFGISYLTLRDKAFDVTAGSVTGARRKQAGSNRRWTVTVEPDSASGAVTITLPETTDCEADGAICTEDDRPLSHSLTATVTASTSSGDMAGGDTADDAADALNVADGISPRRAAAALFGEPALGELRLKALDRLGNRSGRYDLGDLLSWMERCRQGEVSCGGSSTNPGAGAAAALLAGSAGGRRNPGRPGRGHDSGGGQRASAGRARRWAGLARCALVALLAAAITWSCTDDRGGPAGPERNPGLVTVALDVPAADRAIGVLLEVEGPGIEAVRAHGFELFESGESARHQIILAGALRQGPVARFHVPNRDRTGLYRIRVVQVAGEDYELIDPGEYRAVITR